MYDESSIVKLLGKKLDTWTLPAKNWARSEGEPVICPKCWKLKLGVYPTPVDVRLRHLETGTSYDFVFRGGVAVVHEQLLEWLRPYMRGFVLGRCLWEDGSPIPGYHSIYMRDALRTRAGQDAEYHVCEVCGQAGGSWGATPYALRVEIPVGDVFQDQIRVLWLSSSLARQFPWRRFSDQKPFSIPVRDEPLADDPLPARPVRD